MNDDGNRRAFAVGFYLVPDFPMMAFAAAVEPLRSANRLSGARLFDWCVLSVDGQPVCASNGIAIAADAALRAVPHVDLLLVCTGTPALPDKAVVRTLRAFARSGAAIGGISLGAYVLAYAGLLNGHRCAVHWENLAAFAEQFPRVRTTSDLFVVDGARYTCSGGTAALDMLLHLIAGRHGFALATAVSEQFIHPRIRAARDPQRMALQSRLGIAHSKLIDVVGIMEGAIDEPRDVQAIASDVGLSTRQLERLFGKYLGASPRGYYRALRLERARTLLQQTTRPVLEIALACGFATASHFSRCYRDAYGYKPSAERAPRYARFAERS